MDPVSFMNKVSLEEQVRAGSVGPRVKPVYTALEVLLAYAAILYYIWHWQFTHPLVWIVLFTAMLLTHAWHRDTFRTLGLSRAELRASAQIVLTFAVVLSVPLLVYGFARHRLVPITPNRHALESFLAYGVWCVFQQYLAQSYFHNRLMAIISNRHVSSILIGIMFGAAHIPNPVLMIATGIGGFIFAEIFARHRNIWPLALAQAVGGFLLAAVFPDTILHHMRVGPGYYFYRLH
jgi:membrane protease YdiL (CAAX protease family)